ncbi:AAA family ATPase [Amedibacillus sp. YH-ame10]
MKKEIYKGEIKVTQAKREIVYKGGNQQSSYNLSLLLEEKLKEANVIVPSGTYEGQFVLSHDYTLILSPKVIELIGESFDNKNNKLIFTHTEAADGTTKFQLKRKDNSNTPYSWFKELYDQNVVGSIISFFLDQEKKELIFDVQFPNGAQSTLYDVVAIEQDISEGTGVYRNANYQKEHMQMIYYGAPGTGKSYKVTQEILKEYPEYEKEGSPFVFRVTIHPEYTYYDFIGNIMPVVSVDENNNKSIEYSFKAGVFTKALKIALDPKNSQNTVFLVMEEMSRGNISAIFGDLFQILDRKEGISEYGIYNDLISNYIFDVDNNEIRLPKNLSILGTVNTSDQNVYVMDTAFKRRFDFEYISTDIIDGLNDFVFTLNGKEISWLRFCDVFNSYIVEKLGFAEDKQLGQFYIRTDSTEEAILNKLSDKLLYYLWNDIHLASLSGVSIIDDSIKSFSKLLKKFKNKENIFVQDFFDKF